MDFLPLQVLSDHEPVSISISPWNLPPRLCPWSPNKTQRQVNCFRYYMQKPTLCRTRLPFCHITALETISKCTKATQNTDWPRRKKLKHLLLIKCAKLCQRSIFKLYVHGNRDSKVMSMLIKNATSFPLFRKLKWPQESQHPIKAI